MTDTPKFIADAKILKVGSYTDADGQELGLIFGFAMICKVRQDDGTFADYVDTDGDEFPEGAMLEASTDFAKSKRVACTMHERDANDNPVQDGGVIHHFPLTEDIAKALGIDTPLTGLLIALQPDDPETLEKARRGEYTGFSIGGEALQIEDVTE